MKWKIIAKLLYLVILFAVAAYKWERESQLIDSDYKMDVRATEQTYNQA